MNLLIAENPMVVSPTLACRIGIEEAIFLQQIHFLSQHSRNEKDGYKWVYNTYEEWVDTFPFFKNSDKVKRIVSKLEKLGALITTDKYNSLKIDKRKWYRVNYECKLLIIGEKAKMPDDGAKMPDDGAKMPDEGAKMPDQYTKTYNKENIYPLTPTDASHCDAGAPPVAADATTAQQDSVALQTKPKRNSKADQVPCSELLEAYNEILGGMLPKAQLLTQTRKRRFVSRWLEIVGTTAPNGKTRYTGRDDGLTWWRSLFAKVKLNPFWLGENDSGWCADLDWILKPANFVKILEWKPAKR